LTDRLYHDPAFAQFYDCHTGWSADKLYVRALAQGVAGILDLGCGTGQLGAALAGEDKIAFTGVDLAPAMLALARAQPGGDKAEWIEGDARDIRLGRTFDLIVMTGHAFQTALTDTDRRAYLETIAAHLSPGGRFIFDSRNPEAREWESWTPDLSREMLHHRVHGMVESWNDVEWDKMRKVATYDTFFLLSGTPDPIHAQSQIGFISQPRLAKLIASAGLRVDRWMGDWDGGVFNEEAPEIIAIGRLAAEQCGI